MSVRVAATGQVSDGQQAGVESDLFTRSFPLPSDTVATELDLVDIICGGNGRGQRLAAAIDPLTGQWDQREWQFPFGPGNQRSDGGYHQCVLAPVHRRRIRTKDNGEPLQIDSAGRHVQLPPSRGALHVGPNLGAAGYERLALVGRAADVWGAETYPVITVRLAQAGSGGIGIHSSVGITFDLRAIGDAAPRFDRSLDGPR